MADFERGSASESLVLNDSGAILGEDARIDTKTPKKGMSWSVIVASAAVVLGGVGQAVFLPLLLGSLGQEAGAYVTLMLLCITFALMFAGASLVQYFSGRLKPSDLEIRDAAFILIGLCDCLNGLLTVFSSALSRTPGALQAILPQLAIPFTLALSYLLYRVSLTRQEIMGATLVVVGILVTMAPSFAALASPDSDGSMSSPLYPALFAIGVVPGVLTNVLQTGIYRRHPGFNKSLFLFYRTSYQAAFAVALFWCDLVPGLGTSSSMEEMIAHLKYGITCIFDPSSEHPKCYDASWLGVLFTLSYVCTYYASAYVIEAASANYVALLSTANTPLAAMVWFVAPALTLWAGGSSYSPLELGVGVGALFVLIVPGSILYKLAETKKRAEEAAAKAEAWADEETGAADDAAPRPGAAGPLLLGPTTELTERLLDEPDGKPRAPGDPVRMERLRRLRDAIDAELAAATDDPASARFLVYVR
jgi:drug/metabolite transporter (DMT)-like permease